ncbi:MAG: hypothetical protein KAJ12_08660 [Bacteroidetes bacterium]|nr:hypothetical protein [Bacteroidota bacterium]
MTGLFSSILGSPSVIPKVPFGGPENMLPASPGPLNRGFGGLMNRGFSQGQPRVKGFQSLLMKQRPQGNVGGKLKARMGFHLQRLGRRRAGAGSKNR